MFQNRTLKIVKSAIIEQRRDKVFKETFCKNLKRAREEKQYTQQYVADVVCTSRSNITKYENGQLEPNIETIGQLAELYDVSTDWIFGIKKSN